MTKDNNSKGLSGLDLTLGGIGILCPVPIVGEAALAGFLYKLIKTGMDCETGPAVLASIPASALTRFKLYDSFYIPVMDFASNYLPQIQPYLDTFKDLIS